MGLFIKFLMAVVIVGVAGLFVLKRPDGQPWLDYHSFIPDLRQQLSDLKGVKNNLSDKVESVVNSGSESSTTLVYKWRDANGVLQYSDTPPDNVQSEIMTLNNSTNIIQSTPVSESAPEIAERNKTTYLSAPDEGEKEAPLLKGGLENIVSDAKNVEALLQQRKLQQDKATNH